MAMQIASNMSTHAKTGSTGSMPYPSLPASPTLTNPDMILPDYDDPTSDADRSHSPLMMWKNAQPSDMQHFDLNAQPYPTGPVTPTTPIIYGNGTMLSDIGEVTEAESVRAAVRTRIISRGNFAPHELASRSPATVVTYEPKGLKRQPEQGPVARERRLSMESTSTITNGEHAGLFADFDDAVSVDDSNFQGDDEESMAESYAYDDTSVVEDVTPQASKLNVAFEPGEEERYSTALSRRAEEILANAKRRLTTMEGNLTRARTSVSISSIDSGSTPSPPMVWSANAPHRDHETKALGHSRISSENNIPSDTKRTLGSPRSSSALGAAGGYREPLQTSRSVEYIRESPTTSSPLGGSIYGNSTFAKSKTSLHDSKHTLQPLSEDEVSQSFDSPRPSLDEASMDSFLSPTFGSFNDKGVRRSASTNQMRDLKDQMNDLKGRLSTLRDQARADTMKRRSMSSLRTPSPFTHARVDQWYNRKEGDGTTSPSNADSSSPYQNSNDPKDEQITTEIDEESLISGYTENMGSSPTTKLSPAESHMHTVDRAIVAGSPSEVNDDVDDMRTEDGYEDESFQEQGDDELSESDSAYHDSVQNQVSHEDRDDAFDYEHFFLHSAMGSMSQKRLKRRGSRDSLTSEGSVETTRGPTTLGSAGGDTGLRRRPSNMSTSSAESFATATEGPSSSGADTDKSDEGEAEWEQVDRDTAAREGPQSTEASKRTTFGFGQGVTSSLESVSERTGRSDPNHSRASNTRRSHSSNAGPMAHRPSISSFESSGTTRSFPLVNRPKSNSGVLTPRESPDQELRQISESIMSETASIYEGAPGEKAPIESLQRADQILVERLVASLGRCVLGLTESGRASVENRSYRRRIDAARRILEGLDHPA